jgi:hypothetical protein
MDKQVFLYLLIKAAKKSRLQKSVRIIDRIIHPGVQKLFRLVKI